MATVLGVVSWTVNASQAGSIRPGADGRPGANAVPGADDGSPVRTGGTEETEAPDPSGVQSSFVTFCRESIGEFGPAACPDDSTGPASPRAFPAPFDGGPAPGRAHRAARRPAPPDVRSANGTELAFRNLERALERSRGPATFLDAPEGPSAAEDAPRALAEPADRTPPASSTGAQGGPDRTVASGPRRGPPVAIVPLPSSFALGVGVLTCVAVAEFLRRRSRRFPG